MVGITFKGVRRPFGERPCRVRALARRATAVEAKKDGIKHLREAGDATPTFEAQTETPGGLEAPELYIAQVAGMLGVSPSLIRQWERHGFINPGRTRGSFRVFRAPDIDRLRSIRDLSRSGLNAAGIKLALESLETPAAAPMPDQTSIGTRLLRLRRAKQMSLRDLGAATKLSPSHISALERSISHPSVAVLQRLTSALGTNIMTILGGEPLPGQLVVRPDERRPLDTNLKGVEIQQLYRVETVLETLMFIVDPGADSGASYQHDGEENLFILEGTLKVTLDEIEDFNLEVGDSMTFPSHRPHRFRNEGNNKAVILWVNTPPTF